MTNLQQKHHQEFTPRHQSLWCESGAELEIDKSVCV